MRAMTRPMKDELGEVTGLLADVEREIGGIVKRAVLLRMTGYTQSFSVD